MAAGAPRVAIMTDEIGWHTRQLQAALRERGAIGRCVDLADCRIDTTARVAWPGDPRLRPRPARRGAGARHRRRQLRAGDQAPGCAARAARTRRAGLQRCARDRAQRRQVDDQPAAARGRRADAADLGHRVGGAGAAYRDARERRRPRAGAQAAVRLAGQGPAAGRHGRRRASPAAAARRRTTDRWPICSASLPPLTEPGFDWRVLVVGGRAVTAMRRVSTHWVHNVAQGARCEPARADARAGAGWRETRARALDMDYAGVDILPAADAHALQVIEVNGVAAWQGLQRVTRLQHRARDRRRPARPQAGSVAPARRAPRRA